MYANKCPDCGANLDPCERCDCRDQEKDSAVGQAPAVPEGKKQFKGGSSHEEE